MNNKLFSAISMARKAGKLIYGFDSVIENANKGKVFLIMATEDLSEKTFKNLEFACEDIQEVLKIDLTQDSLAKIIGKKTGIIAITDENLAKLCLNALQ